MNELSLILKQVKNVKADNFIELVESVTDQMSNEEGRMGNITITGRLAKLAPSGEALVIGDLHGDLESLTTIIEKSNFINKMNATKDAIMIFLGDYGDRGPSQTELYFTVLSLKAQFPEQVVLLRGNHEGPIDLMASPHDLPHQLHTKLKDKGILAYAKLVKLFACLYNAVYVEGRYLMVHGGLSPSICNLPDLAMADQVHPEKSFLKELLWNDPDDMVDGFYPSPRGAGFLFGRTVTEDILRRLDAKILIRGHEAAPEGYKINHLGKVLTLFSRKGPPYTNTTAAYLNMPLNEKFENANQLLTYIHKF